MAAVRTRGLYHELRWRRRAAWIYSAICLLVAGGLGVVLSSFVTPVVLLVAGLTLKLAAWIGVPLDAVSGTAAIRGWARYQINNFEQLLHAIDKIDSIGGWASTLHPLGRLATVAIPALAIGILVWLWLRALNLRAGGAELIELVSARPPAFADQSERRLSNMLETAAIAAGVPTPRLFLIEQPVVNAAAIGTSPENSAVLVTRGLLDALSPAETEAVLGRLVATICAGDLPVALSVNAAFQTFGFFLTLLDLPVRCGAWRTLGSLALVSITPRPSPQSVARTATLLDESLDAATIVDINKLIAKFPIRLIGTLVTAPLLPFILISALFKMVMFLWTAFFMAPPLWLMWRSRCFWTDATAARRNVDPNELAGALGRMTDVPEGAELRAYLFFTGRERRQGATTGSQTLTTVSAPSADARRRRLSMLAADPDQPSDERKRGGCGLFVLLAVLAIVLLPPLLLLLVLVGYLTLIVMTIALAAGLLLVAALV